MAVILKEPIEKIILDALAEHDFFDPLEADDPTKSIYQTATKHILEFNGQPPHQATLAVRVTTKDIGSVHDLLRLAPAFCKAIDSTWDDALGWLNEGLKQFEGSGLNPEIHRNGINFILKPMPEIGFVMIEANLNNNKPQAPDQ